MGATARPTFISRNIMATIKVYAVADKLHVRMLVHYGKIATTVEFTGGKLTRTGNTPATLTTSNTTLQKFIEGSVEFKNGTIVLQRVLVDGTAKPITPKKNVNANTEAPATAPEKETEEEATVEELGDESSSEETIKTFDRLADAKEWLEEMGVNVTSIIKKQQAEQLASGLGYKLTWK